MIEDTDKINLCEKCSTKLTLGVSQTCTDNVVGCLVAHLGWECKKCLGKEKVDEKDKDLF